MFKWLKRLFSKKKEKRPIEVKIITSPKKRRITPGHHFPVKPMKPIKYGGLIEKFGDKKKNKRRIGQSDN